MGAEKSSDCAACGAEGRAVHEGVVLCETCAALGSVIDDTDGVATKPADADNDGRLN